MALAAGDAQEILKDMVGNLEYAEVIP